MWAAFEQNELHRWRMDGGEQATWQMQRLHEKEQAIRCAGMLALRKEQSRRRIFKECLDPPEATLLQRVCAEDQRPVVLHRLQQVIHEGDVFKMVGTPCKQNKSGWKTTLQHLHGRIRQSTKTESCRNFRTGLETQVDSGNACEDIAANVCRVLVGSGNGTGITSIGSRGKNSRSSTAFNEAVGTREIPVDGQAVAV